jgi:tRNA(Ile)-lysidine synthase
MADLGPWGRDRRVVVAVSGGADSMCLAWLAKAWGQPFGLIVDHGLRPEAAGESALAAAGLASFGVPSRILKLEGLQPGPGLAARARQARYAALVEAAASLGLTDILLAHHARDQAETVLIRRRARSGPAGLAGIAPVTETASARVLRPLLSVAPGRLRATLARNGIGWSEDPSNRNLAALRNRLRAELDDAAGDGPGTTALVRQAHLGACRRAETEGLAAEYLGRHLCLFPEGYALLAPGPIGAAPLAGLIRALSGDIYPPRGAALERLVALSAAGPLVGTVAGVRFLPAGRLAAGTLVVREPAAMQHAIPAVDGVLWDGRFRLRAPEGLPDGAEIGALGKGAARFRRASDLPSAVLRTLPAVRLQHELLALPHLPQFNGPALHGSPFIGWTNPRLRLSFEPAGPAGGAPFAVGRNLQASPCGSGDA